MQTNHESGLGNEGTKAFIMASNTLTPAVDDTNRQTFNLVSTSLNKTAWVAPSRKLATPYQISVERKLASGKSNDQIVLRILRIENNATTGLPATASITLNISLPKDQTILTAAEMTKMIVAIGSIIGDSALGAATVVAVTSLIEGRDL